MIIHIYRNCFESYFVLKEFKYIFVFILNNKRITQINENID